MEEFFSKLTMPSIVAEVQNLINGGEAVVLEEMLSQIVDAAYGVAEYVAQVMAECWGWIKDIRWLAGSVGQALEFITTDSMAAFFLK